MSRLPLRIAIVLLLACGLLALCAAARALKPRFTLQEVLDQDAGIPQLADWRKERLLDGMGWKLATVSRGEGSVMQGGITVIQRSKVQLLKGGASEHADVPVTLRHCYVLAAFDLLPREHLLVTVRDPQRYWPGYDYKQGLTDPLELVWYDESWKEEQSLLLSYAGTAFPDDFVLSADQRTLLAIRHPVDDEGKPDPAGHALDLIYLNDGSIKAVALPEAGAQGQLPAEWQPVLMQWDSRGKLLVQAGQQARKYEVAWE
jgi:hypothetical protein